MCQDCVIGPGAGAGEPARTAAATDRPAGTWAGRLGPPLAGYAAVRAVQLAVLAAVPAALPVRERLVAHDGHWYAAIAARGYPDALPVGPAGVRANPVAFFPGYPMAVRAVASAGLPVWLAEVLVAVVAGAAAVAMVYLVAEAVAGPVVGRRAALGWALAPPGFVLGLAYAEGLFVAAAGACLYCLLRQRWLLAGLFGAAGTAIRPTGAALVVAALVAAVPVLVRRPAFRPLAALALVPAGGIGYVGWLWLRTGRLDAWFATERDGWGARADFGLALAKVAGYCLLHPTGRPLYWVVCTTAAATAALLAVAVRQRLPAPLLAYSLAVVLIGGTSGIATMGSLPRIVYTAFPLFIPASVELGRLPPWARYALAAGSLALLLLATALTVIPNGYIP